MQTDEKKLNSTMTNLDINGWSVLFNAPNSIAWIRIILLFISLRYFGKQKYVLFVIYHTISGFLDSFDGILARTFHQQSMVGQFFELILDQYAHFIMYSCIGYLYSSYIVYFYFEIALELWSSTFHLYITSLAKSDQPWLHKTTFLSTTCSLTIYSHPELRLLNWYGPDVFHTLLVIRFILINDHERKLTSKLQRYISMKKVYLIIQYGIYFTGFFALLRTLVTSCFMLNNFYRIAGAT
ncbi:unnamed protein product [Adineta steineri]|uniref:CDP-diacylglycerol--inositol 3-phosphatidyltransferase n=1 Tax=Adineta steineri TaxID=433720 RepID=A0A818GES3_9BILA|nr:unnamed protein product [Adineta steineri]